MSEFISGQPQISDVWFRALQAILFMGHGVSPRGNRTLELLQHTLKIDMRYPVLNCPPRKLSYKFMAAEAYWILSGSNKVSEIAPYNPHIADFSDDGEVFFGAYGPKIMAQLGYVVDKLVSDRSTRQAVITIWRESPPNTKDVPCTVALAFNIRGSQLHCHSFMRSNDIWLGTPYDMFNFSMVAHLVCTIYNTTTGVKERVVPGTLFHTAASLHLYEVNFEAANQLTVKDVRNSKHPTPESLFLDGPGRLLSYLERLRNSVPGSELRWWEEIT